MSGLRALARPILLFAAFVALPVLVWQGDRNLAWDLVLRSQRKDLADQGRRIAEDLQQAAPNHAWIESSLSEFGEFAHTWLWEDGSDPERLAARHRRSLDLLPPHDLVVVANDRGQWQRRFLATAGLGLDRDLGACERLAAMAAMARDERSADPLMATLSAGIGLPIAYPLLRSSFRGRLLEFHAPGPRRALWWQGFPAANRAIGSETRTFVLAVLDPTRLPDDLGVRRRLAAWDDPAIGVGFIRDDGVTSHFSNHWRAWSGLAAAAKRRVRMAEGWPAEGILQGDRLLVGLPPVATLRYHVVVALPLPAAMQRGRAADDPVSLPLLLLAALLVIGRMGFGRGPRWSVSLVLVGTFLLAQWLPLSGLRAVFRLAMIEFESKWQADETETLHRRLLDLDEGVVDEADRFVQLLRRLASSSAFIEQVRRDEEGRVASQLQNLEASLKSAMPHPGPMHLLLLVVGPDRYSRTWITTTRSGIESGGRLFHPLLRRRLDRVWSETGAAGERASRAGIEFDVSRDVLMSNLGVDWFLRLLHFPDRLHLLRVNLGHLYLAEVPLVWEGRWRYVLMAMWDDPTMAFHHLSRHLGVDPPPATAPTRIYSVNALYTHRESLPPGWKTEAGMMDLVHRAARTRMPVQGRAVASDGVRLLEALPTVHLDERILVGVRVQPDLGWQLRRLLLGSVGMALAVALLLARAAASFFTQPLQRLLLGMGEVQRGVLDRPLADADRADEFGVLAGSFNAMLERLRQREVLGRFVSDSVRRAVSDERFRVAAREGEHREMTILFLSLADFESWRAGKAPAVVGAVLERFLTAVDAGVAAHGGEIDKVMGAKILVFIDHLRAGGAAATARAAMAVIGAVRARLAGAVPGPDGAPLPGFVVEAGVHCGNVVAGILGAPQVRLSYTVIGDPVNLAARLAAVAHGLAGSRVVFSGAFYELVRAEHRAERLPVRQVKGKTQQVEVWHWLDPDRPTPPRGE